MDATEVAFFGDPQLMIRGILVNGRGQRYVNEDTYPGRIGQETLLRNVKAAQANVARARADQELARTKHGRDADLFARPGRAGRG